MNAKINFVCISNDYLLHCFMKLFLLLILLPVTKNFSQDLPADKRATKETVNLYRNLKILMSKGTMFGHQDDLAYGYGWKYENSRSDIKDVTGDYPAVYGWELGRIEIDQPVNLDSVPFDKMKQFIKDGYERGCCNYYKLAFE